jgi:cell division protein FtsW
MRGAERAGLPTSSLLLALIGALCVFGVVMVGSASEVVSIATYGSPWAILLREVMWMAIGLVVLVVTCRVDYRRWRRFGVPLLIVSVVLLLVVLVPGIGVSAGGSSRWIGFGQFRIQPSELAKLALAIFGADLVCRREQRGGDHRTIIGPLLLVAALAGGLVLLQPDMGTALVLACMTLALLVASGVSMRPLVKVGGGLVVLAVIVGLIEPYRRARLLSFLDPTAHAKGSGYQVVQSLIGLGSGHVFGLGLGSSHEKWGLLPNAHTDFIYSVIGEELGFIGAIAVLIALGAFAWFGLRTAQRSPDRFGALLSVTLVAWIASETFINIGAVVGLLPVTGIPLPFISFGGSSLVITLAAAGMLVNVARHEVRPGAGGNWAAPLAESDRALAGGRR